MKRTRFAWAVASIMTALTVVCLVVAVFTSAAKSTQIRESQVTNTRTLENTESTLEIVKDCTQAGGECFERNQRQTRDVVTDLNRVAVLAAACADKRGVQGEGEIYACVVRSLAAEDR